jgi:hypothetical protein
MEFFNKKEDVIDLELTPVGEVLLSQGEFTPAYYAFFDDEILYDGKYGGVIELQKETKGRIKDTVRMKPQVVFRTIDKPTQNWSGEGTLTLENIDTAAGDILEITKAIATGKGAALTKLSFQQQYLTGPRVLEQDPVTKNFALPLSLGNSSYDSVSLPAWNIKFWHGSLNSAISLLTSSARPFLKIPQIEAEIIYKSYKTSTSLPKDYLSETGKDKSRKKYKEFEELHEDPVIIGEDGTDELYYDFDEDHIVLEILEENTPYSKENFEIEVFEIEKQSTAPKEYEEVLIPKYFIKPPTHIKNDLLMSFEEKQLQTEKELQQEFPDLDSTYVEYYFEISADNEIDNELMCEVKPLNKKKGVFISDQYDCLDPKEDIPITNIYGVEENNTSLPDCE